MGSATAVVGGAYVGAICIASISAFVILLMIIPLMWHIRNFNIGASFLVAWLAYLNLENFVNAIIWRNDDMDHWYMGTGLCDIEVKFQTASQVGLPAALLCVLRTLNEVMKAKNNQLTLSDKKKKMNRTIEFAICIVPATIQILLAFIASPHRYYLWGISGCVPAVGDNWLTVGLVFLPPLIWAGVDAIYAVMILVRLVIYKNDFQKILKQSATNRGSFVRLYLLCSTWLLVLVPVQIWAFSQNFDIIKTSFSWNDAHNPADYHQIIANASHGRVLYDRFIWTGSGFLVFAMFGTSRDALSIYRKLLMKVRLHHVFPRIDPQHVKERSTSGESEGLLSSINSKAKSLFSHGSSIDSDLPKTKSSFSRYSRSSLHDAISYFGPIKKLWPTNSTSNNLQYAIRSPVERGASFCSAARPQAKRSLREVFKSSKWSMGTAGLRRYYPDNNIYELPVYANTTTTTHAEVSGGCLLSPVTAEACTSERSVHVKKEVRQRSETAETMPFPAAYIR